MTVRKWTPKMDGVGNKWAWTTASSRDEAFALVKKNGDPLAYWTDRDGCIHVYVPEKTLSSSRSLRRGLSPMP
jgi:hypothetical protein